MRQHPTEPDDDSPDPDAEWEGTTTRPTDGTRRPGSNIVGESPGSPEPGTKRPLFARASLARNRTDPSQGAGRTAVIYLGFVLGIIAIALVFLLLLDL